MMRLLPVTALVALTLVVLSPQIVAAQSQRPSDSEAVSHSVILGDKITVSIETEIETRIKEARLWVRPHGRDTIPSYSYLEFTQNISRVQATGEIDVRLPSYFPPGTIFDVRFEFVSVDGDVYPSHTYHVEHIDDYHDWRRVSDNRLEIIYYGIDDRAIESLHSKTTSRLPEISAALGVEDVPQFRAVIFPNLRELTIHGPTISGAATQGHYFGGFAYGQYNLTIMSSPSASTLIHELTHLIFGRALTSPYATSVPAWLNEGNASYWETGSRQDSLRSFRSIARSGNVTEFAAMNSVPGLRNDIGNFYTQSTDFVGYLIENYGADSIGALLSELNTGKGINNALRTVYGGSLSELENGWRREWELPSVSSREIQVDIKAEILATIPGLPTIVTGTLENLSKPERNDENEIQVAISNPEPEATATVVPQASVSVAPEATVEPTSAPATPAPTRTSVYFTGPPDDEWPQVKPSAIIVFLLLGLGVMAMMYRRFRT